MILLWINYVISVLFLLCFHARLFIDGFGHLLEKDFIVMSNCEVVAFPLVFWVGCGA